MGGFAMPLVFLAIVIVVMVIGAAQSNKKKKSGEYNASVQKTTLDAQVKTDFPAMDVFISGLAHHCSREDVGIFTGAVFNEKGNAVNRKAMAVWDNRTQKVIGYIPEAVLDKYRDYCEGKRCPCVGYIFFDGECLRGRVRSYQQGADQATVMKDIAEYASQVCDHFGWPVPTFSAK